MLGNMAFTQARYVERNAMKTCFVVSPIGTLGSEIRKRSDGGLREVIRPVLEAAGYEVFRADEDKTPGMVTEAIINKLIDFDLVVADLHGHNPNVMYEVAIRHATDKPLIQMIEHGESLPFDIGGLNTIFYEYSLDGLAKWRADLRTAVKDIHAGSTGSNPVARAWLVRALTESQDSEAIALSMLLEEMQHLRGELSRGHVFSTDELRRHVGARENAIFHRILEARLLIEPCLAGLRTGVEVREDMVAIWLNDWDAEAPFRYHYSKDDPDYPEGLAASMVARFVMETAENRRSIE
jgi:hypothetical protein